MSANTPPKPHTEGMVFTNDETGIKYQFSGGAWRAVSSSASEEVVDAISKLDLQTVLDNGNVADKALAIQTEQGVRVLEDQALRITHQNNPYIRLVDEADMDSVEISLQSDHAHIDLSDANDELHFKFAGQEKVTFKGEGDAEFLGKVKVEPGTEGNEAVTYGQLATVAEELEQLAPSFERGIYSISTQEVTSSSTHNGKYNLIRKNTSSDGNAARAACADAQNLCNRIPDNDPIDCQIEYNRCIDAIPGPGTVDIYISDFSRVEQLKFSKVDVNGEDHTWDGVLIGQLIDVFNEDNDNYMVGRITAIEGTTVKTFSVDVLSSKGSASGNARIKVFSLSETGDVTNYVRKTGDTMTGILETTSNIWIHPDGNGANGTSNMLVVNQEAAASGSIARFQRNAADVLKIEFDGSTSLMNNRLKKLATPIENTDGTNKKYVDDAVAAVNGPASHKWTYREGKDKLDLLPGEFTGPNDHKYGKGKHFSYYFHPESLTSRMGFYKDYDMYFPMDALWGAFHFWDTNYAPQWKLKQYVPVRNIHMFKDDNYLEIYTHTDYPQGGEVISRFDDGRDYHFSIGGMI